MMRKVLSLIGKILLIGVVAVLAIAVILIGALMFLLRPPSDRAIIRGTFSRPDLPGYSSIRVLEGSDRYARERVITLEVVLESYTGPVNCRGEIYYRHGDPSVRALRWYDWACIGHWIVVGNARDALDDISFPCDFPFCSRYEFAALTLKRWVENGWIRVDQIRWLLMRERVHILVESQVLPPMPPAPFDVSTAHIYDLAPELPEEEKVPTYIWRCDGTIDLIWRGGPEWWKQPIDRKPGDIELPLPIDAAEP